MKKKNIIYIILFVLSFFLFGLFLVSQNIDNKYSKYAKDNTPTSIKVFLKNTLFYIPIKLRELENLKEEKNKLYEKYLKIKSENDELKVKLYSGKYEEIEIDNFKLKSFELPHILDNYKTIFNNKKQGYLEQYEDKLVVVFGSGKIIYFNKNNYLEKKFIFKEIKSNLFFNNYFNNDYIWTGVKDIKIVNDNIYLSITEEKEKNCSATSIIYSKLNFDNLKFSKIFSPEECVIHDQIIKGFRYFDGMQAGGRMVYLKNKLYMSIGDYNIWNLPQKDSSIFGKIVEIDLNTNKYEIVSKGHRNTQGLQILSKDNNLIISSDHGPKGGDEINLINLDNNLEKNNFGWPLSSYGSHYDVVPLNSYTKKFAPLHKSHFEYGFEEPIFIFQNSIGISEIIKNHYSESNQYLITSLKEKSIFIIEVNTETSDSKIINEIKIGERIRDIIYDKINNCFYLYLEGTPKVLKLIKII